MLRCSFCARDLVYVHGHATCVASDCPLRTLNQAECCTGETGCFLGVPRSPLADGSIRESGEFDRAESGAALGAPDTARTSGEVAGRRAS